MRDSNTVPFVGVYAGRRKAFVGVYLSILLFKCAFAWVV